jgi:hypothetical protein
MRAIRKFGSMRGVWKRSQGRATKAPPDERGGNRHARPNAIPRHTSTLPTRDVASNVSNAQEAVIPQRLANKPKLNAQPRLAMRPTEVEQLATGLGACSLQEREHRAVFLTSAADAA